ncbi:MFS transporter [Nocardiopsis composta]
MAAVIPGTLLNALNSSMIVLALVPIERDYGVGLAAASWLISAFYLAATVCMPLMGRLADRFGARRVFVSGLALVCATSALAPLAPSIGWLIAARVLLAVGTSVAFPAAMAVFRTALPGGPPQGAMALVGTANSSAAAFGPVLGGLLVQAWGWQATWLVNVPVTVVGMVLALVLLPPVPPRAPASARGALADLDLPGIAAYAVAAGSLVAFLLGLSDGPSWALLGTAAAAGALLVLRETRTATPFLDLRAMAADRRLPLVFAQNTAVAVVFYLSFIGIPQWLQGGRGLDPASAGLVMLPLTGVSALLLPLVARGLRRFGERPVLLTGSALLLCGSGWLLLVDADTPVWALAALAALLGLPNAFNNLGLQSAMYRAAPDDRIGVVSGLFQTFRFFGSITAAVLVGAVFADGADDAGLRTAATVMAAVSVLLVLAGAVGRGGPSGRRLQSDP